MNRLGLIHSAITIVRGNNTTAYKEVTMVTFKDNKILTIQSEMGNISTGAYPINGIDTSKAIYFYRFDLEQFQVLATGDYTITTSGGNTYLQLGFTQDILDKIVGVQVCYEETFDASTYTPTFSPDVNLMLDELNKLVDDTSDLWEYIRKQAFVADTDDEITILPKLNSNEIWVKTDDGYRALNIGDIEEDLKNFYEQIPIIEAEIEAKGDEQVARVEDEGDTQTERVEALADSLILDFDGIYRMYSVIMGAWRYLSGNNLQLRDSYILEKTVEGGNVATRQATDLYAEYNGADLASRTDINTHIDLGLLTRVVI